MFSRERNTNESSPAQREIATTAPECPSEFSANRIGWAHLLAMGFGLAASVATAGTKNFVFILADDLGVTDLSYTGSRFYETPNIDQLAASGMRFDQGYAASRVCSPSRASIMTGKATPRHGITDWIGAKTGTNWKRHDSILPAEYIHRLPAEETTLAEAFQKAGYSTFFAGKWHLGDEGSWPEDHGFQINKGGWHSGSPRGGYFAPWSNPRLKSGPDGELLTLRLANETAAFIEAHQDKPFFAFLSFYAPHGPIQTTKELHEKYCAKAKVLGLTGQKSRFKFDRRLPVRQVQDNPIYAGMMESLDTAVGIVMNKLKETGLDKNTVVIFTSDNGGVSSGDSYSTSLLPYRGGKGRQWEGGIREPYLIHAPGITKAGSTSEVPVIGMDFYPTMLELAGLPLLPEQHVDGVSLVPVLKGEEIAERDLYWHYPHYGNQGGEPSSVIRSKEWKLIQYYEDGRVELYNINDDPGEQSDLAGTHPEQVENLKKRLKAWLEETNAKIPARDPRYKKALFDAKIKTASGATMKMLEKRHEQYLEPDWQPAGPKPWWGSSED